MVPASLRIILFVAIVVGCFYRFVFSSLQLHFKFSACRLYLPMRIGNLADDLRPRYRCASTALPMRIGK
jgi:hypothetical protein